MEIKLRLLDTRLNCVVLVIPRELHSSLQVTLLVPCAIILVISCSREIHCCVMRLGVATMKNRKAGTYLYRGSVERIYQIETLRFTQRNDGITWTWSVYEYCHGGFVESHCWKKSFYFVCLLSHIQVTVLS